MRNATKTAATWLGVVAGIAGLEHGYFEFLQGDVPPPRLMFPSMGPPCDPDVIWNACEPALTILPNLQAAGLLTILLGILIIIWSMFFIQSKHGGWVLIVLSILLLLAGGGIFPPLIGILGGAAGTQINKPLPEKPPSRMARLGAKLWPWSLVILMIWLLGQFPVGYFFNDILKGIMGFGLLLILSMLPLSVYSAYAADLLQTQPQAD
jgi:hypothetical protein